MPSLSESESALLDEMREHLLLAMEQAGGALAFDRFMELALYAPRLGYYVNGRRRFGEAGDFVTAPELSPLFGDCVANFCARWLERIEDGDILEFGAGSGRLACDVLRRLEALDRLPACYQILELSPDLQQTQHERLMRELPHLADRVSWVQTLPEAGFRGVMLGNELLDAMPVHRFRRTSDATWQELFVRHDGSGFVDSWRELTSPGLESALEETWADLDPPDAGYSSEINQRLKPWLASVAARLDAGCVLLVDYGYTRSEYYHAERRHGTLICHYRHRAHADPYLLPGLQDMTANVDFSAVASAAIAADLRVLGYTTQAHFLLDNGLEALLAESDPEDIRAHLDLTRGLKKLTLPSEMGERFKAIALARGIASPPRQGFLTRDFSDRL